MGYVFLFYSVISIFQLTTLVGRTPFDRFTQSYKINGKYDHYCFISHERISNGSDLK